MEACFAAFCTNWCQTKPTLRGGFCCGSSSNSDVLDDVEREQREHKLKKSESTRTKMSEQNGREGSIRSTRSNRLRRASQAGRPEAGNTNGESWNGGQVNAGGVGGVNDEKWKNMVENRARRSRSWSGEFDEAEANGPRRPSVEMPVPQWGLPPSPTIYQPAPQLPMQIPPIDIPDNEAFSAAFEASIPPSLRPGTPISTPDPVYSSPTRAQGPNFESGFNAYSATDSNGDYNGITRTQSVGAQAGMPAYPQTALVPHMIHDHSQARFGSRDGTAELCTDEVVDLSVPRGIYTGSDDPGAQVKFPSGGEESSTGASFAPPRPAWQRERRYSRDGSEIGVVVDEQRLLG